MVLTRHAGLSADEGCGVHWDQSLEVVEAHLAGLMLVTDMRSEFFGDRYPVHNYLTSGTAHAVLRTLSFCPSHFWDPPRCEQGTQEGREKSTCCITCFHLGGTAKQTSLHSSYYAAMAEPNSMARTEPRRSGTLLQVPLARPQVKTVEAARAQAPHNLQ